MQTRMPKQYAVTESECETTVSLDESGLAAFLLPLIKSGPPEIATKPWLEPITRIWPPKREIDVQSTMALGSNQITFKMRHPALDLPCFLAIDERKVGRSPRSSSRGRQARYYCPKVGRTLRAASDGEYFLMVWRQIDPDKSHIVEQPIYLRYRGAHGLWREHRPDLFELRVLVPWFVEWKYEKEAAKHQSKWESIGCALSLLGFGYEVITERHTKQPVRFSNIKRIWLARRSLPEWPLITAALCAVKTQIQGAGTCTIGTLLNIVPELNFRKVLALTYHNVIPTDIELPLSTESPLFPPRNDEPLRRVYHMITDPYSVAP